MFALIVITLAYCSSVVLSSDCYYCQNFEFENEFYDPNCSSNQYSGHTISCEEDAHCFTDVYEDGRLHRGCEIKHNQVKCVHHNYPHQTQCFCDGNLCNIDLCNECIDGPNTPTIQTTETTTVTYDRTSTSSPTKSSVVSTVSTVSTGTHEQTTPTISTIPSMPTTETTQIITTDVTTPSTPQISSDSTDVPTSTSEVSYTETSRTISTDITTPSASQIPTDTTEVTNPTSEVSSYSPEVTTLTPEVTTSNTPTITIVESTTPIKIVNITCYDCQNSHPDWEAFDETCPQSGYNGNTYACDNCGSCFTEVHDDGSVIRGEAGDFTEKCAYGEDFVACYCIKDLCNTQLCEKCEGRGR